MKSFILLIVAILIASCTNPVSQSEKMVSVSFVFKNDLFAQRSTAVTYGYRITGDGMESIEGSNIAPGSSITVNIPVGENRRVEMRRYMFGTLEKVINEPLNLTPGKQQTIVLNDLSKWEKQTDATPRLYVNKATLKEGTDEIQLRFSSVRDSIVYLHFELKNAIIDSMWLAVPDEQTRVDYYENEGTILVFPGGTALTGTGSIVNLKVSGTEKGKDVSFINLIAEKAGGDSADVVADKSVGVQ